MLSRARSVLWQIATLAMPLLACGGGEDAATNTDAGGPARCEVGDLMAQMDTVDLMTSVPNTWDTYTSPLVIDMNRAGQGWIGWGGNDGMARLTPVDVNLARQGDDIVIPYKNVYDIIAHDDGSVAALVAKMEGPAFVAGRGFRENWPPSAYVVRYGANGQEQMRAHVAGGEGFVPDPNNPEHVRRGGVGNFFPSGKASLAFDGQHYGAYYMYIKHGFPGDGNHHADEYVEVDRTGREIRRQTWMASHAFFLNQSVTPEGHLAGVSVIHPARPHLGVVYHDWTVSDQRNPRYAWPPAALLETVTMTGFPVTIGSFFRMGGDMFLSVATYVTDSAPPWNRNQWYPRLVRLDADGQTVNSVQLSPTPIATPGDHTSPFVFSYAAPFGPDQVMAVWADFGNSLYNSSNCQVGVFRTDGTVVAEPRQVNFPLVYDMHLAAMGNGDVAWVFTDIPNRRTLRIIRWRAPQCS